jgi:hypothetical protein
MNLIVTENDSIGWAARCNCDDSVWAAFHESFQ